MADLLFLLYLNCLPEKLWGKVYFAFPSKEHQHSAEHFRTEPLEEAALPCHGVLILFASN